MRERERGFGNLLVSISAQSISVSILFPWVGQVDAMVKFTKKSKEDDLIVGMQTWESQELLG